MDTSHARTAPTSPPARRRLRTLAAALLVAAALALYAAGTTERRAGGGAPGRGGAPPPGGPAPGFLVSSPRCHIPDVDPRHASIRKYLAGGARIVCARHAPLTYTSRDEQGRSSLHLDRGLAGNYVANAAAALRCCYANVTRVSDSKNNETSCAPFEGSVSLAPTTDLVYVLCTDAKGKKVYANLHAVVHAPPPPPPTPPTTPTTPPPPRRPSVLLLGIDSMSRLNMLRSMPRTVALLRAQGWLELRGYNKVGDNTIPNLMAILTGRNMAQLREIGCALPQAGKAGYDHCPFIWKRFKRLGYATSYLEDEFLLSTFNYMSAGFRQPPTDYYLRPLMVEAVKKLAVRKTDGLITCLEATRTTDHFLKFTLDLLASFHAAALFAVVWLNNFSHNNYNTPAVMDVPFFDFFQELAGSDAINETVIVFLSDHGARFGKIRETYVGWLEERLPFVFIWLPPWFRAQHPEASRSLAQHGGRLTSPYDLHLTLRALADDTVDGPGNGSLGCPTCTSLFAPPSHDRSCADAGISTHWCTCVTQEVTSPSGETVAGAVRAALRDVNARLALLGNGTRPCAELTLNQVLSARVAAHSGGGDSGGARHDDFVVVFDTRPGLAVLDATVRHWASDAPPRFEVMGMVSRINTIGADGKCIDDKDLRLYCYCLQ